jgi:hypothetical protein
MLPPTPPDYPKWSAAFVLAGLATIVGVFLLAKAGIGGAGRVLSGVAGLALIAGAIVGFRHYWRNGV